jgi:hypothetical protein
MEARKEEEEPKCFYKSVIEWAPSSWLTSCAYFHPTTASHSWCCRKEFWVWFFTIQTSKKTLPRLCVVKYALANSLLSP